MIALSVESVPLGSMVVRARLIPSAEYGRYAVALIVGELIMVPAQSVFASLVQRTAISREHIQSAVALALLMGLALVGLCWWQPKS